MNSKFFRIFILTVLFICTSHGRIIQAQNEMDIKSLPERIDDIKNQLALKLLLNNEQSIKIDTILTRYFSQSISKENREVTLKSINSEVGILLTEKQKTKFDILKSKWLDEILGSVE